MLSRWMLHIKCMRQRDGVTDDTWTFVKLRPSGKTISELQIVIEPSIVSWPVTHEWLCSDVNEFRCRFNISVAWVTAMIFLNCVWVRWMLGAWWEKLYLTTAGIWTRGLRFTSPTFYQLRYKAKPGAGLGMIVFVFHISKLTSSSIS